MVQPQIAAVRPRVFVPGSEDAVLLEDLVRERLDEDRLGVIVLHGPRGSGRSTALAHLAAVIGPHPYLVLWDGYLHGPNMSPPAIQQKALCIAIHHEDAMQERVEVWRLALWTADDRIEYLLARHPAACGSVVARLIKSPGELDLGGLPALEQPLLDRLATDPALAGIAAAISALLTDAITDTRHRRRIEQVAFFDQVRIHHPELPSIERNPPATDSEVIDRLLRQPAVRQMLACDYIVRRLARGKAARILSKRMPATLLAAAGPRVAESAPAVAVLRCVLEQDYPPHHAMAASLLHAAELPWTPPVDGDVDLADAVLDGVAWPGLQLRRIRLHRARLRGANLFAVRFKECDAQSANLSQIDLSGAELGRWQAKFCNLADANLAGVQAPMCQLAHADLQRANLEGAHLPSADLKRADLRRSNFRGAILIGADLLAADVAGADFTNAILTFAELAGLDLRTCQLAGARLDDANLWNANLEDLVLPDARLSRAGLREALLTGTVMPRAELCGANLRQAALADIDWEDADLRDADLTGVSFHLGSTRCGHFGSPIACEGSRTGFYTDEYHEQDFKTPEQIRKANLCGADLRGAQVEQADFYLVDLRGAKYSHKQVEHFLRCKAILK